MFKRGHRLYLRIYLAVLASLALAVLLIGLAWRFASDTHQYAPTFEAFAEIAAEVLPPSHEPREAQQAALARWHKRARANLALYTAEGETIASAGAALPPPDIAQTQSGWLPAHRGPPAFALRLPDRRWLVVQRHHLGRRVPFGFAATLVLIAAAVGLGAYPVVRRLTRRLERLQVSVEALGAGDLSARVRVRGHDEVARLAESFNRSAARIEALIGSQKALLANASHELRSPLARIRMAVEILKNGAQPALKKELERDIAELDQLIEEILLASRLDATHSAQEVFEQVDFTALIAEECARADAQFEGVLVTMMGSPKLLRRMVRNLLDNARRYGGNAQIEVTLRESPARSIELDICDRGPGVLETEREKIFEPFYRLPGARERDGSMGLGLALVKQIARKHGGDANCLPRAGGGTCFRVNLASAAISNARLTTGNQQVD